MQNKINKTIKRIIFIILSFTMLVNAIGCSQTKSTSEIKMPNNAEYYIGSKWNVDSLTKHFEELGFTNIRTSPYEPDDDNYKNNIQEIYIQTSMFSTDPWKVGEKYPSDAEISIYCN